MTLVRVDADLWIFVYIYDSFEVFYSHLEAAK